MLILFCLFAAPALVGAIWLFAPPAKLFRLVTVAERWRAGMAEKTVTLDGRRIAYLDGGRATDAAPVLLVHGSSGDKDNWNRVARHLTPHRRVIAVDLPGFGDSDRLPHLDEGLQDQVDALGMIIAALGLERLHLGGNSLGARVVAVYAAQHPQQVLSLWLPGPGGVLSAMPSDLLRHLQRGDDNPLFIRQPESYEDYLRWLMAEPPAIPAPIRAAMAARAVAKADFHRSVFAAVSAETASLEQVMRSSRIPTRIVWGDRDRIWHVSGADILTGHMARASALLLPGIGHLPMIEAPQAVATDYLAFLNTL